jgi:hypothetical protein
MRIMLSMGSCWSIRDQVGQLGKVENTEWEGREYDGS